MKNVDIRKIFLSLQCSWIKRLYDDSFHEWKIISLYLISKPFDKSFIFNSNLPCKKKLIKSFPSFYKEILINWKTFFLEHQSILSQFLWCNIYIQIDENDLHFTRFPQKKFELRFSAF